MFDYSAIRKFYFDKGAEKCANDPDAKGRFESAFFHTIKMVHDSVAAQSAERIAKLENDLQTLNAALVTTSEGNAQLICQRDDLIAAMNRPAVQASPRAWAAFTADGSIRVWTSKPDDLKRLSQQTGGLALTPLYDLAGAPVAIMDTRDALGLCAPTERIR